MSFATCPFADDVLAHFLDGAAEQRSVHDLQEHLQHCEACREILGATRRLDALVATSTPAAVDDALADRLLTDAMSDAAPPRPVRSRLALQRVGWLAAGFVAAALLQLWPGATPPPTDEPARAAATSDAAAAARSRMELQLPGDRAPGSTATLDSSRRARLAELRTNLAVRALRDDFARALEQGMLARALALGLPVAGPAGARACARTLADAQRRARATELLTSSPRRADVAALCTLLADDGCDAALLSAARQSNAFGARLQHALRGEPSADLLVAAARLGSIELDRALRAAVAGDAAAADAVAAAAALPGRPRQIVFLLDLWSDLQRRGIESDARRDDDLALARAERWFAPLPASATAALIAQAHATRHAERRRNCLLALAGRGDAAAIPFLLEIALGRRHEESMLAAFALARCASDRPDGLRRAALAARQPAVLLAALVSMRDSAALASLDDLPLSDGERAFLHAGAFSRRQIPIAARLLQQHRPAF
jgi:hypothetical protein